ncbi:MAG: helix-turn-helix domain-containing protein [bacterium]
MKLLKIGILILYLLSNKEIMGKHKEGMKNHDEIESYGKFILPSSKWAISENIVKISIPSVIESDTITRAFFYVHYSKLLSNKMSRAIVDTLIDIDSISPFETIWDCSNVPDQDSYNLKFYCKVINKEGDVKGGDRAFSLGIPLDRNKSLSKKEWRSVSTKDSIVIDGNFEEWGLNESIVFENSNNRITGYSKWDKQNLYFAVKVEDLEIFPNECCPEIERIAPYLQDGIEFFFDISHDHNEIRNCDERQIMIPLRYLCCNVLNERVPVLNCKGDTKNWKPELALKEMDYGYNIEIAFSWGEFDIVPWDNLTLGFNLVNSDCENKFGVVMTNSWAGISDLLHHNPSEWGNLQLVQKKNNQALYIILCLIVISVLAFCIFFYLKKKRSKVERIQNIDISAHEMLVKSAKKHILMNYINEKYGLKEAAAHVNLSPDYLRKVFKKISGRNFGDYLNYIRIKKAKELLKNSNKRITEIAFSVGYGSLEYFNKVFKGKEKLTPSEFRKQNNNDMS